MILIHGNGGGSGRNCWLPYIQQELEKIGVECLAPDFPDNRLARAKYWLPFLKEELQAGEDTILVGYSSGSIAAMRFAEKNKILGSVLTATYHTSLGEETEKQSGYFDEPWQWADIRNNQNWTAVFASTDDRSIPIEEPRFIRDRLGTEYYEFNDRGHFFSKTFPELLDVLKEKLGPRQRSPTPRPSPLIS